MDDADRDMAELEDDERHYVAGWNAGWAAALEAVNAAVVDLDADQLEDRVVAPTTDTCEAS